MKRPSVEEVVRDYLAGIEAESKPETPLQQMVHRSRLQVVEELRNVLRAHAADRPGPCPHAAPFHYCQRCVETPCPIGLSDSGATAAA